MEHLGLASWLFALITTTSVASTGIGVYHFGPDVSENYACYRAEINARMDAIRKVVGENIYVDEFYQCKETQSGKNCVNDMAVFSMTDSYVKSIKSKSRTVHEMYGRKTCTVDIEARVSTDKPNIDAYVDGRFMYKDGENMQFKMATNVPTKVYIFHVEGKKATLMWPTFVGTNNTVANELTLPTPGYKFTARASRGRFDESLVFVFTNEDLKLMRDYEVEDLNTKLVSIPIKDRRIVRRNLVIEQ